MYIHCIPTLHFHLFIYFIITPPTAPAAASPINPYVRAFEEAAGVSAVVSSFLASPRPSSLEYKDSIKLRKAGADSLRSSLTILYPIKQELKVSKSETVVLVPRVAGVWKRHCPISELLLASLTARLFSVSVPLFSSLCFKAAMLGGKIAQVLVSGKTETNFSVP